jgi:hypothetical protein
MIYLTIMSGSDCIILNAGMLNEFWSGKNVEERGHDLISQYFAGETRKSWKISVRIACVPTEFKSPESTCLMYNKEMLYVNVGKICWTFDKLVGTQMKII